MKRITNFLRSVSRVAGLVIAWCPLFAHAAPTTGDRYTVDFSGVGLSHAKAEFALGNQIAGGNFLIENLRIRLIAPGWSPADMTQGFYNPQVNRLVQCLDLGCTQYLATGSTSILGLVGFTPEAIQLGGNLYTGGSVSGRGAYSVNPVPTGGKYTVALNSFCYSSSLCDPLDPLFSSGNATFALGSPLAGGNYGIQQLEIELAMFFFSTDMLFGYYNPQINQLVKCLDASCTQHSSTVTLSPLAGYMSFSNDNSWFYDGHGSRNLRGTYAITPAFIPEPPTLIPEPPTYAMTMAGLGLLGIVARRRKQQTTV